MVDKQATALTKWYAHHLTEGANTANTGANGPGGPVEGDAARRGAVLPADEGGPGELGQHPDGALTSSRWDRAAATAVPVDSELGRMATGWIRPQVRRYKAAVRASRLARDALRHIANLHAETSPRGPGRKLRGQTEMTAHQAGARARSQAANRARRAITRASTEEEAARRAVRGQNATQHGGVLVAHRRRGSIAAINVDRVMAAEGTVLSAVGLGNHGSAQGPGIAAPMDESLARWALAQIDSELEEITAPEGTHRRCARWLGEPNGTHGHLKCNKIANGQCTRPTPQGTTLLGITVTNGEPRRITACLKGSEWEVRAEYRCEDSDCQMVDQACAMSRLGKQAVAVGICAPAGDSRMGVPRRAPATSYRLVATLRDQEETANSWWGVWASIWQVLGRNTQRSRILAEAEDTATLRLARQNLSLIHI